MEVEEDSLGKIMDRMPVVGQWAEAGILPVGEVDKGQRLTDCTLKIPDLSIDANDYNVHGTLVQLLVWSLSMVFVEVNADCNAFIKFAASLFLIVGRTL